MALSLETGETREILRGASDARHVATETGGYLLYWRGGDRESATLFASPFDLESLTVREGETAVVHGLSSKDSGAASFEVASNGTLVYVRTGGRLDETRSLAWVASDGNLTPLPMEPRPVVSAPLSPDGSRIAMHFREANEDIWIHLTRVSPRFS